MLAKTNFEQELKNNRDNQKKCKETSFSDSQAHSQAELPVTFQSFESHLFQLRRLFWVFYRTWYSDTFSGRIACTLVF